MSPALTVAATAIRLPMRRWLPIGAVIPVRHLVEADDDGIVHRQRRNDAVAVEALGVVAAVRRESWRRRHRYQFQEFAARSNRTCPAARRGGRSCAPARCAARRHPSPSAAPDRHGCAAGCVPLLPGRGSARGSTPRSGWCAGAEARWLLQLDLAKRRDLGMRGGVGLARRRQGEEALPHRLRHRRQPIDDLAPADAGSMVQGAPIWSHVHA